MGLLKKVIKAAGYGGSMVCKKCGQKRGVMSTSVCKGTIKPHKWVKA